MGKSLSEITRASDDDYYTFASPIQNKLQKVKGGRECDSLRAPGLKQKSRREC
jgi:hypothetical protein